MTLNCSPCWSRPKDGKQVIPSITRRARAASGRLLHVPGADSDGAAAMRRHRQGIDVSDRPTLRLPRWRQARRSVDDEELLSTTEAAQYLQLTDPRNLRYIARRLGLGRKLGGKWMFTRRELDAYRETRSGLPHGTQRMRGYRVAVPPDPLRDAVAQGELLDATAAAAVLEVSRQHLYALAQHGRLGSYHGGRPMFTRTEVEAYKASRREKGERSRTRAADEPR